MIENQDINALFSQIQNKDETIIKKLQQGKLTIDLVLVTICKYQSHFLDYKLLKTRTYRFLKHY